MAARHWAPSARAQEQVPVSGCASTVVMYAGMCWVSGITGTSEADGLGAELDVECRRAIQRLRTALSTVGAVLDDVLTLTVVLRRAEGLTVFDAVMGEFFSGPFPARLLLGPPLIGNVVVSAQAVCRAEAVLRRVGADRVSKETLI